MVNEASAKTRERRDRDRSGAPKEGVLHQGVLGGAKLNPFGDLHSLQHLSARFARGLRGVFEPLLRQEVRCWAEPLVVQRFTDYRAERSDALTAWLPLIMTPGMAQALCIMDGKFVLEMLDMFFGGTGAAPHTLPTEFSPAAEAMVARIGQMIAAPLKTAWEPMARFDFLPTRVEVNPAMIADLDGEDAMIVTRFGIAAGTAKPVFHGGTKVGEITEYSDRLSLTLLSVHRAAGVGPVARAAAVDPAELRQRIRDKLDEMNSRLAADD